jgi:hypothetical protein
MSDCDVMRESMPLLLTESLDPAQRELTHQHIETCPICAEEWSGFKDAWRLMADLPEVEVPARVKARFLAQVLPQEQPSNVVPFRSRPAFKWVAQAAAVAIIAGGSYLVGHRSQPVTLQPSQAQVTGVQALPVSLTNTPQYSIAETRVLHAASVSPNIEGRPDIHNVQFSDENPTDPEIKVGFDITSHVTVTGRPTDKSMVRLLRYVLENEDNTSPSRTRAIDWVRQMYSRPGNGDPEIADALANVLRNDEHQGVRIKAADTLKNLASTAETRDALIEALKSDPNPAVRIKAVEALANLARSGAAFDAEMVDTLRQKASQGDENVYVRVKAAEALSNIRP